MTKLSTIQAIQRRSKKKRYNERKAANQCVQCGLTPPVENEVRCQICKNKLNNMTNRRRDRRVNDGNCRRCGLPRENHNKTHCEKCLAFKRNDESSRRREIIAAYGGLCSCHKCPFHSVVIDISFLALDHVNNDGNIHRKEIGAASNRIYAWAKREFIKNGEWPTNLQVLCHNCNHSKMINGGVCVHMDTSG